MSLPRGAGKILTHGHEERTKHMEIEKTARELVDCKTGSQGKELAYLQLDARIDSTGVGNFA